MATSVSRVVTNVIDCEQEEEGLNALVYKGIGNRKLRNVDPFVILYDFTATFPAGFPDHPHRGFETLTYILTGGLEHEDFLGHQGVINAGDLQYMMAGRGVVHSEMPYGETEVHGVQLWINLKAADKMMEPSYQDLLDKDVPKFSSDDGGTTVRVIAGEAFNLKSEVQTRTPIIYLDCEIKRSGTSRLKIPTSWAAFVYILSGTAQFGRRMNAVRGEAHQTLVLSSECQEDTLFIENTTSDCCRFLLIGGEPIKESIVQNGPFVMNTHAEIRNARIDYKKHANGFENAKTWASHSVKEGVVQALF